MRICTVVSRNYTKVANSYGHSIWVYRVVEHEPHQRGYLSEKNVKLLWESEPITYQSTKITTKCGKSLHEAERIAECGNRCLNFSLPKKIRSYLLNADIRALVKEIHEKHEKRLIPILKDLLIDIKFPEKYMQKYIDHLSQSYHVPNCWVLKN